MSPRRLSILQINKWTTIRNISKTKTTDKNYKIEMDKNYKIELKTKATVYSPISRPVFWRIVPSELSFWHRLFNPWRRLYAVNATFMERKEFFDSDDYRSLKEKLLSVDDVRLYEAEQEAELKRLKNSIRNNWGD